MKRNPVKEYARIEADRRSWTTMTTDRQIPTMSHWGRLTERPRAILSWLCKYLVLDDLGTRFIPSPWQTRLVGSVYRGSVGAPMQIDRVVISVGRKQGKTTFVCGLNLWGMAGPQAPRGRWWLAAASGSLEQSEILFSFLSRFVEREPALGRRFKIAPSAQSIVHRSNRNTLLTLSTSSRSAQGREVTSGGFMLDEYSQARDGSLLNAFDYSTRTTDRGLGWVMSTNSTRPGNPLADRVKQIRKAHRSGKMKNWHLCLHAADLDKYSEWSDRALKSANPGLVAYPGQAPVVDWELLKADREAARASTSEKRYFLAYRLNSGKSDGTHLTDALTWSRLEARPKDRPTEADLRGARCHLGLDLSMKGDLTCLAFFFPDIEAGGGDGCGFLTVDTFYPKSAIFDLEESHKVPAVEWEKAGWISGCEGATVDYMMVVDRIVKAFDEHDVKAVRLDPWGTAGLRPALASVDIDMPADPRFQPVRQGYKSFTPIILEAERRIENGLIRHDGNPVLSWCLDGMLVQSDARATSDSRKPFKSDSSVKIDAAVAALMAVGLTDEPEPSKPATQAPSLFYQAVRDGALDR